MPSDHANPDRHSLNCDHQPYNLPVGPNLRVVILVDVISKAMLKSGDTDSRVCLIRVFEFVCCHNFGPGEVDWALTYKVTVICLHEWFPIWIKYLLFIHLEYLATVISF